MNGNSDFIKWIGNKKNVFLYSAFETKVKISLYSSNQISRLCIKYII